MLVGVYRAENAAHVGRLIHPALSHGWSTAWWALDRVAPDLVDVTVGEGRGEKLPLLNQILERIAVTARWTVVSDDDLRFRRGDVVRFVDMCDRAGLDLAQPARARRTQQSHDITAAIRFVRARRTTFVESGPLFAVGPRWRERLLPFPSQRGMGWGVELDWFDLARQGCALGVVDQCTVEHLGTVGDAYDTAEMHRRVTAELADRGAASWTPFQRTLAAWRPWQRRPPWHGSPS